MELEICSDCQLPNPEMVSDGCYSETDGRQDTPTDYVTECCNADKEAKTDACDECYEYSGEYNPGKQYDYLSQELLFCVDHKQEYIENNLT